jgi:hypothetical protein
MQKLLLSIVTLAILIGYTMAAPIPTTKLPVFSGSQSTNIDGSYSQCCGGGASVSMDSAMTRSMVHAPNATLSMTGSCSGVACDCYSSSQAQNVVDLTPLYENCKGGSVEVRCNLDMSCQYDVMNISYIQADKGLDKGQFWPAPLNATCASNTGNSCAHLTYLRNYSYVCNFVTMEYCTVNIPLVDPALTGGALLMTILAYMGQGCGNMECGYGGGGSYYTSCSLQNMTCPGKN